MKRYQLNSFFSNEAIKMFEIKDKTTSGSFKEDAGANQCYSSNDQVPISLLHGNVYFYHLFNNAFIVIYIMKIQFYFSHILPLNNL